VYHSTLGLRVIKKKEEKLGIDQSSPVEICQREKSAEKKSPKFSGSPPSSTLACSTDTVHLSTVRAIYIRKRSSCVRTRSIYVRTRVHECLLCARGTSLRSFRVDTPPIVRLQNTVHLFSWRKKGFRLQLCSVHLCLLCARG